MDSLQNYRRLLKQGDNNSFILPYGNIVLRNISSKGSLIAYRSEKQYKDRGRIPPWILLKLKVFRSSTKEFFPIFLCSECQKMKGLESLCFNQNFEDVKEVRCIHSKAAENIVKEKGSWTSIWDQDFSNISTDVEVFEPKYKDDTEFVTLRQDDLFLACFFDKAKNHAPSVLYTISTKGKSPNCSKCSNKACKCYRLYKAAVIAKHKECNPNSDDGPKLYSQKRKGTSKSSNNTHYDVPTSFKQYGYNRHKLMYPIWRDPVTLQKFEENAEEKLHLPSSFKPIYDPDLLCPHGNSFDPSEESLVAIPYSNVKIHSEFNDTTENIKVYGRPTIGNCKCLDEQDTSCYLLWNLGGGRFLRYEFLLSILHKFTNLSAVNSILNARADQMSSMGQKTDLTNEKAMKGFVGFCRLLKYEDTDWQCDVCGETPEMITVDGKIIFS